MINLCVEKLKTERLHFKVSSTLYKILYLILIT